MHITSCTAGVCAGKTIRVLVAAGLAMAALACSAPRPADVPTVSFFHYFTGSLSSGIDEMARVVNAGRSDLRFQPTPVEHESFKSAIRFQLEGPNPPDLFSYWAGAKTRNLVERKAVASLEGLFGGAIPDDLFEPAVRAALFYEGKPYMVPITRHYVGIFYNKRLFDQAGLAEPRSWDEFVAACRVFKAKGVTPLALGAAERWPAQFWFDYLLLRGAGFAWRQELMDGKRQMTDPEVRAAFGRWKELIDQGFFNQDETELSWDVAANRVAGGSCAMTLMGTWLTGLYDDLKLEYGRDYGFFAFPSLPGSADRSALGPIDGVMLSAGSQHAEAARAVLAALALPANQTAFSRAVGSVPPVRGIAPSELTAAQRHAADIIAGSGDWAFNFDLATSPERSEIGLDALKAFVSAPEALDTILTSWNSRLEALEP